MPQSHYPILGAGAAITHGQGTFLAPSADKQTCNHDTRVLKPRSLPINPKVKGIESKQDEMVSHINKFTSKCHSRILHPRSGDCQGQGTFLAPSAEKKTCNHETQECSNHHPALSTLRSNGLSRSKMKYIYIYTYMYIYTDLIF